jgi:hypothetical protein
MDRSAVRDASRLVAKALQPRLTPRDDKDYLELAQRFRADPDFEAFVTAVAAGLELDVLDSRVADSGLVLVPSGPDSRFAMKAVDLRRALDAKQKQAVAILTAVVAKVCFPTQGHLDDASLPSRVTFDMFMKEARDLGKRHGEPPPDDPTADVAAGWKLIHKMTVKTPDQERVRLTTLTGLMRLVLNRLEEGGCLRSYSQAVDESGETWLTTRRFQLQIRECALPAWFRIVQEGRAGTLAPAPTPVAEAVEAAEGEEEDEDP